MNRMFVSYNKPQQPTPVVRNGVNGFMSVLSDVTGGDKNTEPQPQQTPQVNLADSPEAKEFFMNSLGFDSSMVYEGDIQEDYNHMVGIIKAPPTPYPNPGYNAFTPPVPPYGAPPAYGGYPPINPYPYLTQGQIMDAAASASVMLQTPPPAPLSLPGASEGEDYPPF